MFNKTNISVDSDLCVACGECVDRCIMDNLRLSVAPCRQACPLETSCQTYIRYLALENGEKAAMKLRENTPFAAVLGHVCHHPCESKCQREAVAGDGAVHIRAIRRYLSETYPHIVNGPVDREEATGLKVAVVGAGPAGLSAAYELAAKGHAVDIYEEKPLAGGMLRYAIPAYRLPDSVVDATVKQATDMGVNLLLSRKLGRDFTLAGLKKDYDAVILALGLPESVIPKASGAEGPRVYGALELLASLREGKCPQAESSIIVGGGNTALDTALSLKKGGVKDVSIVTLEGPHDLPVHADELAEAKEEGIKFFHRWGVASIGEKDGKAEVTLKRCLSVFDGNDRFAPEMDPLATTRMQADMVVFAIGQKAEEGFSRLRDHDRHGNVEEKVFVAGDCGRGASSVVEALADGRRVAEIVHRSLLGIYPLEHDAWAAKGMVRQYETPAPERAKGGKRGKVARIPVSDRNLERLVEQTLTADEALAEAGRCMACGHSFESSNNCWVCLPCELSCPVQALNVKMPYLMR